MSLDESHKQSAQGLKKAFENWENVSPSDSLWNKLNESLDTEFAKNHAQTEKPHSIGEAFSDWDADVPGDTLWAKIDADLSTESVWNKLDNSLDASTNPDAWITGAYSEWSTGTNNDGWSKLDEALSRERVWTRLNNTLSKPIATSSHWLKYAASLTVFFFLSFFMNDESRERTVMVSNSSKTVESNNTNTETDPEITNPSTVGTDNTNPTDGITVAQRIPLNVNDEKNTNPFEEKEKQRLEIVRSTEERRLSETSDLSFLDNQKNAFSESFETNLLGGKYTDFANLHRVNLELPSRLRYSTWTISVGTQLSLLDESTRDQISTVTPRLGLTGELAFSKHFNKWGLSQSVGYSQFAQTNGNYVNGRYLNSQQQLRVLQFNTSVFYSMKRFDINGGLVFARLISGDEQQNSKIVNVYYMTNSIQAGLTGGVSYNLTPSAQRMQLRIGAQYQWIPQISAGNSTFRDIQGFKLLGKISF